jgi:alanyl-tRNA synthetase
MTSAEIRSRFLAFFEKRKHAVIPSASLITPDEKGVTNATLFNTAGMQPLVPYLLGKPHPKGTRLVDVQKCMRTVDLEDIGDKTHATFFEMLGNWSLGDYFKTEAINWSYEFLTSKVEGLGLDPNRLYVTVFEGDSNAPRDDEAADIWKGVFKKHKVDFGGDTTQGKAGRIFYLPAKNNWWEAGDNGPCGPDTEMFYDISNKFGGKLLTHKEYVEADDARDIIEIWNDVFMQYEKKDGKIIGKLPKPSVDTGAGLERLTMTMMGVDNIYDTDLFKPVMDLMAKAENDIRNKRIIADHLRASVFLIADGVIPSNTDRGYILRRLIRRAVINTTDKKLDEKRIGAFVDVLAKVYEKAYPELCQKINEIKAVLNEECKKFAQALASATSQFEKYTREGKSLSGIDAFTLFSSYGLPIDVTKELAKEKNLVVDVKGFEEEFKKHQDLSRAGAEKKFKGGLGDTSEMSVKYHTATHLLHQALREVLGTHVSQKGSNITPERLRFDFTHTAKMTDEEKKKVEDLVNSKIKDKLAVHRIELPKDEAEKTGALHFFGDKYGDIVSIYYIGDDIKSAYSKEFCGGPHVENIGTLGAFKIQKEEAVSAGVRRIKAVLS